MLIRVQSLCFTKDFKGYSGIRAKGSGNQTQRGRSAIQGIAFREEILTIQGIVPEKRKRQIDSGNQLRRKPIQGIVSR